MGIIRVIVMYALVYHSIEMYYRRVLKKQLPDFVETILMFPFHCLIRPFPALQSLFEREVPLVRDPEMPILDETLYCDYSDEAIQAALRMYGNVPERFFNSPEEYASYRNAYQQLSSGHDVEQSMDDLLSSIDAIPGS